MIRGRMMAGWNLTFPPSSQAPTWSSFGRPGHPSTLPNEKGPLLSAEGLLSYPARTDPSAVNAGLSGASEECTAQSTQDLAVITGQIASRLTPGELRDIVENLTGT
ncbi:hypothetical protein TBK1r_03520 [Stieleria magnilauensis]|uniref:Uncharacterized protein n=1 Tax=Stieleria magnilauensis TaxID=2527963 RepID=A0ABX5XHH2_9BACT|nr:hypothetical protein TBK1r_03520 [Planctomycetes bacterium TBK1r]